MEKKENTQHLKGVWDRIEYVCLAHVDSSYHSDKKTQIENKLKVFFEKNGKAYYLCSCDQCKYASYENRIELDDVEGIYKIFEKNIMNYDPFISLENYAFSFKRKSPKTDIACKVLHAGSNKYIIGIQ